jgi:phosphoglycerol transferase MdoB-like AlkP superfamily enzyme
VPAFVARVAIHAGLWLLGFLALFAFLRRPLFAAGVIAALHLLLILVSKAKAAVLREPLVFADLGLYAQALRHPRLYLPYFGLGRALLLIVAGGALVAAGWKFDRPADLGLAAWAGLFTGAVALVLAGTALARDALTLDPGKDVAALGLLPSLWLYWLADDQPLPPVEGPFIKARLEIDVPVVVVQSESFFDARRLGNVAKDVLANYDARAAEGESGRLGVPVRGAYTQRTEFAFLSGIDPRALGVHRFNPYRRFARSGVATIASALKTRGYRTLCLHPYPASFFSRDRVFPELGFDEFLDLKSFENAERQGPYVADSEVTRRILAALATPGRPLFVFAITMENHGPYHLEGGDELEVYLRHLRNADRMIGEICGALKDGVFCLYGDHVPGLPQVYAARGYDDSRTDYLIWSGADRTPRRADREAHELGVRLLEIASVKKGSA